MGCVIYGAITTTLLMGPMRAWACAGCSNPNLPVGRTADALVEKGQWQVGVSVSGTVLHVVHEEDCPDIGPICKVRDEPPMLHDQHLYMGEVRAVIEQGLTDHLGWQLQLPYKVVK